MLYVLVNIFQQCQDNFLSFWVEPVLSSQKSALLNHWHNKGILVSLELKPLDP